MDMVVQAGQLNHVPGCQQAKTSRMSLRVRLEEHSKNSGIQRVSNERIFLFSSSCSYWRQSPTDGTEDGGQR